MSDTNVVARIFVCFLLQVVCVTVLAGVSASAASQGKVEGPAPTYDRSCEKEAVSQTAMDQCVSKEVSELNEEMKVGLKDETRIFGKRVVAGIQDAWLTFESMQCALDGASYKGGTIQPLILGVCKRNLLVERINSIDDLLRSLPH